MILSNPSNPKNQMRIYRDLVDGKVKLKIEKDGKVYNLEDLLK